jgi:phosphatidylethanolamine/phosphatidyl-N-methylethanolamine N-methyltransferase
MREVTTRKIYNIQSKFYDAIAARLVHRRQSSAIARMGIKPGDTVLDIGVGTGVSLSVYPKDCRVVGVDLSEGMLGKAHKRVERLGLKDRSLVLADAMFMPFADQSFDFVMISLVVTVVSDPVRLMENIKRVTKPDARIVIINHFQSGNRFFGWLEKMLCPLCVHLGWKSDLNVHDLLSRVNLEVDFRYKVDTVDLWDIIFLRNCEPGLVNYDRAMQPAQSLGSQLSATVAPATGQVARV